MALAILVMSAMLAWVIVVVLLVISECCLYNDGISGGGRGGYERLDYG